MSRPAAAYDALFVIEGLTKEFDLALDGEVHTLAYLALLLSLSAGRDAEEWGYSFISTNVATPFSGSLDEAITDLAARGIVGAEGPRLLAGGSASAVLKSWASLPANRKRQPFLQAAVAASSSLSPPIAVRSIQREPQLARAEELKELRALPEELGLDDLLEDFKEVDSVLSERGLGAARGKRDAGLLSRAYLWLSYLAEEEGDDEGAGEVPSAA